MPFRRPTFRRPEPPTIDRFVDQLEAELRHAMSVRPPSPASSMQRLWDRASRWMLRPVMHGGLAVGMIFIVAYSLSTPQTRIVMDVSARPTLVSDDAHWVQVVQVPDPVPEAYPLVYREQASRFVVLVEPPAPGPDIPDEVGLTAV